MRQKNSPWCSSETLELANGTLSPCRAFWRRGAATLLRCLPVP